MRISPKKDPLYIYSHPYATLVADEYNMGSDYRIVRPKGTDDHLGISTLAGCGCFAPAGGEEPILLAPGSILIVSPGTPHDYGTSPASGRWHFRWFHFHAPADWLPFLELDGPAAGVALFTGDNLTSIEHRRVRALIADAVARTRRGTPLDRAFAMNALENAFLRLYAAQMNGDENDGEFIDAAGAFIREHLSERLTVERLAKETGGLSASRFAHKFTTAFGESPQAYIEKCRLEYAKRLIETRDVSVKEAAYESGFRDPLYFSRRFRRAYGLPPREIAKR